MLEWVSPSPRLQAEKKEPEKNSANGLPIFFLSSSQPTQGNSATLPPLKASTFYFVFVVVESSPWSLFSQFLIEAWEKKHKVLFICKDFTGNLKDRGRENKQTNITAQL